jgi:hypothetical protein
VSISFDHPASKVRLSTLDKPAKLGISPEGGCTPLLPQLAGSIGTRGAWGGGPSTYGRPRIWTVPRPPLRVGAPVARAAAPGPVRSAAAAGVGVEPAAGGWSTAWVGPGGCGGGCSALPLRWEASVAVNSPTDFLHVRTDVDHFPSISLASRIDSDSGYNHDGSRTHSPTESLDRREREERSSRLSQESLVASSHEVRRSRST